MFFVDTNILVYARDDADSSKRDRAREVMSHLWKTAQGRLSHQVLVEFYSTVTRKLNPGLPREEASADVRELAKWGPISPSLSLFEQAWAIEDRWQLSWWDSLIVAAAKQQDCPVLLTEDLQDGLDFYGVRVMNPFSDHFSLSILD